MLKRDKNTESILTDGTTPNQESPYFMLSDSAVDRTHYKPLDEITHPHIYGQSVGVNHRDTDDIIRVLKQGLPVSSFDQLCLEIDIPAKTLAASTHIATRTLSRRKKEGRLHTDESERLYRIGALYDRTVEVLGHKDTARHWFKTPKKALGGCSPLEYADTEPGAKEVEDLLGRLEHGVFA